MEKSNSAVSIHRPYSEERFLVTGQERDLSSLHRASSIISRDINRSVVNDENSVHSSLDNGRENSILGGRLTVSWNKPPAKNGYKLSYDPNRDGGNEYEIDKPDAVKTPVNEVSETRSILRNVANIDTGSVVHSPIIAPGDVKSVTDNDLNKSRTFITDDTSIPVFDDTSSVHTYIIENTAYTRDDTPIPEEPLDGTYTVRKSKSFTKDTEDIPPDLTYTVRKQHNKAKHERRDDPRMLTPDDRNEPHITYANRKNGKIAKVQHVSKLTDSEKDLKASEISPEQATYRTQVSDPGDTINSLNSSLPPPNFKANLFNRIRKISTPRRVPKFSPVPGTIKPRKIPVFKKNADKEPIKTKAKSDIFPVDRKTKNVISVGATRDKDGVSNIPQLKHKFNGIKEAFVSEGKDKGFGRPKSPQSDSKEAKKKRADIDRYEDVDLIHRIMDLKPKRHRRSINPTNRAASNEQKPISKLHRGQQNTQSGSRLSTKQPTHNIHPLLKEHHSIHNTSADIFSETDKKSRLRQAQYISDDLKIVKTKLQDSGFVAQHIDTQLRNTLQKQSVLGNLNNKSNMDEHVTNKFGPQKYVSEPKESVQGGNGMVKTAAGRNVLTDNTSVRKSSIGATSSQNSRLKPNIWRVLPRIHRFNQNKNRKSSTIRGSSPVSTNTYKTNSVATWVLKSAKHTQRLTERPLVNLTQTKVVTHKNRKSNARRKHVYTQSKQKKASNVDVTDETEQSVEPKVNLIDSGMYMPLGIKKLKRKPKRLKPKLYTQVGKVKGYEVSSEY